MLMRRERMPEKGKNNLSKDFYHTAIQPKVVRTLLLVNLEFTTFLKSLVEIFTMISTFLVNKKKKLITEN